MTFRVYIYDIKHFCCLVNYIVISNCGEQLDKYYDAMYIGTLSSLNISRFENRFIIKLEGGSFCLHTFICNTGVLELFVPLTVM